MGFLPRDDEYITTTVFSTADELTQDGPVLRYPVAGTDTVLPFWVAELTAQPIRADAGRVGGFILRLVLGLVVVVAVGSAVKLIGEGIQLSRPGFYVDAFDVVTGGLYTDEVY